LRKPQLVGIATINYGHTNKGLKFKW
jgi:hypothetical protein